MQMVLITITLTFPAEEVAYECMLQHGTTLGVIAFSLVILRLYLVS